MKLGTYPALSLAEARRDAFGVLGAVERGEDPAEKRKQDRNAGTFEELAQLYLEMHARPNKKPASIKEDTRILNTYLKTTRKLSDGIGQQPSRDMRLPNTTLGSCMTRD